MKGAPFVLVGLLILAGSIYLGKMLLDQSPTDNMRNLTENSGPPDKVFAWGFIDVEPGVAGLYPKQAGDIVELVKENTAVKAGDVLLQINDTLAKYKVDEAAADVKNGEQLLAKAKTLTQFNELQKSQQEALIRSIGHEITTLELKRDRESLTQDNKTLVETIKKFYVEGLAQLAEKKKAEEAKLKQLGLLDAKLDIAQAEAELSAKTVRHKQAQEMLKHSKIVAPSNGTVLRVYVRKGETLGPNPRMHAIDFLPEAPIIVKAEILQEWGRYVEAGQEVDIEDDTYKGPVWKGTIKSLSKWYAPTRSPVIEPLRYNDVRTLECIIELKDTTGVKIGQRVRAKIKVDPKAKK